MTATVLDAAQSYWATARIMRGFCPFRESVVHAPSIMARLARQDPSPAVRARAAAALEPAAGGYSGEEIVG